MERKNKEKFNPELPYGIETLKGNTFFLCQFLNANVTETNEYTLGELLEHFNREEEIFTKATLNSVLDRLSREEIVVKEKTQGKNYKYKISEKGKKLLKATLAFRDVYNEK